MCTIFITYGYPILLRLNMSTFLNLHEQGNLFLKFVVNVTIHISMRRKERVQRSPPVSRVIKINWTFIVSATEWRWATVVMIYNNRYIVATGAYVFNSIAVVAWQASYVKLIFILICWAFVAGTLIERMYFYYLKQIIRHAPRGFKFK